jgi:hypothetical protein
MNCKFLSLVVLLAASTLYYVLRNPSEETVDAWKTAIRKRRLRLKHTVDPQRHPRLNEWAFVLFLLRQGPFGCRWERFCHVEGKRELGSGLGGGLQCVSEFFHIQGV